MTSANPPGQPATVYYAEDHCGRTWPLVASGAVAPLLAVVFAVLSIAFQSWVFIALTVIAVLCWLVFRGEWLRYTWPTGIRLDAEGVRIGGVRWAERHPGRKRSRRKSTVIWQCGRVFESPWGNVRRIGVTRNREKIKLLVRTAYYGRKPTPLGNLAAPFMRAALVIWIDTPDNAQPPEIHPASRWGMGANYSAPGFHQPVWVVPTRHPKRLNAALRSVPMPVGTVSDPYGDPATEAPVPGA